MEEGKPLLYDSFGNYIGPDLDSDGSDADGIQEANAIPGRVPSPGRTENDPDVFMKDADPSTAIILADDKQVYPKASDVFGPDTEAMVEEEDTQRLSEPLVAPKRSIVTVLSESDGSRPRPKYDYEYFAAAILPNPSLCRNIALIGNLHHEAGNFSEDQRRDSASAVLIGQVARVHRIGCAWASQLYGRSCGSVEPGGWSCGVCGLC